MALKDLRELKPGHLLITNHPQSGGVILSVEGRPKYQGNLGSLKDHRAFKVIAPLPGVAEGGDVPPQTTIKVRPGDPPQHEESGPVRVDTILKIPLTESVVIAERPMAVEDVLNIKVGDVVEFPKRFDESLELRIGGRTIAEGMAITVGEKFGLQISAILDPSETVGAMRS